ncbi:MAG: hypothetical protein IJX10_01030 [Phascolarctobacterium sp.]|nr:hypothetical protein [Phascolarctobacterium sp.]
MKPYTLQELEERGLFSSLLSGKPVQNAWAEINNILVEATKAQDLTAAQVKSAVKKWGAKMDETSLEQRSGIYRKLADVIYSEAQSEDDELFAQGKHLAEVLELPLHLVKLADKGAKTNAYYNRCAALLTGEEKLDIQALNKVFSYDYEDGFAIRRQAFDDHFNKIFDGISESRRFSVEVEDGLITDCKTLDIPYEFKPHISSALEKYRSIWNAENHEVTAMTDLNLPLEKGEACYAYANSGLCEHKVVEREDNYFELTRKFNIDETVSFKGEHIEHPTIKEETTVLVELGYFFLTNQRIIFLGQTIHKAIALKDIENATFDGMSMITYHTKNEGNVLFKYSDESAEVMYVIFNRIKKGEYKQ